MTTDSTSATNAASPLGSASSEGLGLAPERARLPNRWRVVCVAGAEPYFERHPDGQWAQREQADAEIERLRAEVANLRDALRWYAEGSHFMMAVQDAWDTVSGEPQNWWGDEAGTAMVEDGRHAKLVLAGELTGAQLHAPED